MDAVISSENRTTDGNAVEVPALIVEQLDEITNLNHILQKILAQEPGVLREIEEIIAHGLERGIFTTTMSDIYQAITPYLNDDQATQQLLSLLGRGDDAEYIERVKANVDPPIWCGLRRMLALYGKEILEAFTVGGEDEGSWRGMQRFLYHDAIADKWRLSIDITKYNGQHVYFLESPESALRIAIGIIDSLNWMPLDKAPAQIGNDVISDFFDLSKRLVSLYTPDLPQEQPESPIEPEEDEIKAES